MLSKKISIIGVPMDFGASRRGVDMGPSAFRVAQVGARLQSLGYQVTDRGNISVDVRENMVEQKSPANAKYLDQIVPVLKELAQKTYDIVKAGEIPLILGGDHSIAMGSVAGISDYYAEQNKKIGILWFDAHGDINTPETSVSGNIHGMPVAHIMGFGHPDLLSFSKRRPMVDPKKIVLIGLRDLDAGEQKTIKEKGVHAFTMRDIDELGLKEVVKRGLEIVNDGTVGFHCSYDMDWIDPTFAPGVGTPVPGGANYREAHLAMEMAYDTKKMISLEVTEVNPILDTRNQTAELGTEMICSAFGKVIL